VAKLAARLSVSPTSYLFTFESEPGFQTPRPGQFVDIAASEDLTLRRPFSVAGVPSPGRFELLVEVRGPGTRALESRQIGSRVEMSGPLGNSFDMPEDGEAALIIAGGIGVAGVRFLASELGRQGFRAHALVGARTGAGLLHHVLPAPTEDGGVIVDVATDDGTEGFQGPVTGLLKRALEMHDGPLRVYCCGPPAMIAGVAESASEAGVPCQALLEEMMACGVGACRGCVVKTRAGYRTVCGDGPVFDTRELALEELVRA
jgi:dihydroorotate dehydrogenase electron transfer subunit